MALYRFFAVMSLLLASASPAFAGACPNIMFVVDQSGSMDEDPTGKLFGHPTKWELAIDAVSQVVSTYGAKVPMGLELFTSSGATDKACFADTMISVEPDHNTSKKIIDTLTAAMPASGTNTGEAVKRAAIDRVLHDSRRANYLVLVTDGDPNCNSGDGGKTPDYTVGQIKAAAAQDPSIRTFVIGFDGTQAVNPTSLNLMAQAGKEPIAGCDPMHGKPCYYSASSAPQFKAAVDAVINSALGGEFDSAGCDDSCHAIGCANKGDVCIISESSPDWHCVPDPCEGIAGGCGEKQFCRSGQCIDACAYRCDAGEQCVDGNCVGDPCTGVSCSSTNVCDPFTGRCVADKCVGKQCAVPMVCDSYSGQCLEDACYSISCPTGTMCVKGGNCQGVDSAPPVQPMTASVSREHGCSMGQRGGVTLLGFALVLLAAAYLFRFRRS